MITQLLLFCLSVLTCSVEPGVILLEGWIQHFLCTFTPSYDSVVCAFKMKNKWNNIDFLINESFSILLYWTVITTSAEPGVMLQAILVWNHTCILWNTVDWKWNYSEIRWRHSEQRMKIQWIYPEKTGSLKRKYCEGFVSSWEKRQNESKMGSKWRPGEPNLVGQW